jgi:anthraniloyl-CoA monooxygenase
VRAQDITVLGGGPAGLYFAALAKKADPDLSIRVIERNPPDATYGWGVVFSDQTLSSFREADQESFERLHDALVLWDAIEIRYRASAMRCGGQGFSGIPRKLLLQILQERCRELGVETTFEHDVTDPLQLTDCDLMVAADGVNSLTRRALSQKLGTKIRTGRSKFIWFGCDLPFDCFTFIFRADDHGVFQVHAYPFDGHTSTFIVECTEEAWRRAGLEDATEADSIAYCEALFAEDLNGHRLLSNRSLWVDFATVTNKTWRHRNVVLLGDAAHTAHFSIGSGTKLAMEDSIALAEALHRHGDIEAAVADYQAERRPPVERFQEAAAQSQSYFEQIPRYFHLEPPQFALHLLTRSGRIDHTSLRVRDPHFVAAVDSWFAGRRSNGERPSVAPGPAFVPFELGDVVLANRVAADVPPRYEAEQGNPAPGEPDRFADAGASGAALVATEPVAVSPEGRITPGCPGLYDDSHQQAWAEISAALKSTGARLYLRLNHAGRRGSTRHRTRGRDLPLPEDERWSVLAPSPIPYRRGAPVPVELKPPEMEQIGAAFAAAARRAVEVGVEVLGIHMGHGYLLGSFLSPLSNDRRDEYGGDLGSRLRFPLEVLAAVRKQWPPPRPLVVALSVDDRAPGGNTLDDAVAIARKLKAASCDMIEVLAGQTVPDTRPRYDFYSASINSDRIRNEALIPTLATGAIGTVDAINTLVGGGRADLCRLIRTVAPGSAIV